MPVSQQAKAAGPAPLPAPEIVKPSGSRPGARRPQTPTPSHRGTRLAVVGLLVAVSLLEWQMAWRHAIGHGSTGSGVHRVSLAALALAALLSGLAAILDLRQRAGAATRPHAGQDGVVLLALIALSRALLLLVAPVFNRSPEVTIGPVAVALGPVALAAVVAFVGMAARTMTGRVWAAITVALGAAVLGIGVAWSSPLIVRIAAGALGARIALPGVPDAPLWTVSVPLYPLAAALCLDLCGAWFAPGRAQRARRYAWLSGACAAFPAAAVATHWASEEMAREVTDAAWRTASALGPQAPEVAEYVGGALVAVLLAGPLAAWAGKAFGDWAARRIPQH